MTKATLWPRIPEWLQRNAFVPQNLNGLSALRDSASVLPLGKDDSGPKFQAVIFDGENPRSACRNHCLIQQAAKVNSVAIGQYHAPPKLLIQGPPAKNSLRVASRARRFPLYEVLSRIISFSNQCSLNLASKADTLLILLCKSQRPLCCLFLRSLGVTHRLDEREETFIRIDRLCHITCSGRPVEKGGLPNPFLLRCKRPFFLTLFSTSKMPSSSEVFRFSPNFDARVRPTAFLHR